MAMLMLAKIEAFMNANSVDLDQTTPQGAA